MDAGGAGGIRGGVLAGAADLRDGRVFSEFWGALPFNYSNDWTLSRAFMESDEYKRQ